MWGAAQSRRGLSTDGAGGSAGGHREGMAVAGGAALTGAGSAVTRHKQQRGERLRGLCFKEDQKSGGGWARAWGHGGFC